MRWGATSWPDCTRTTLMRLSSTTCSSFFGGSASGGGGAQLREAFDFQGGYRIDGVGNSCTRSQRWAWPYLGSACGYAVASVCPIPLGPASLTAKYAHTGRSHRDCRETERDGRYSEGRTLSR